MRFKRFTDRARQAVISAQDEAVRLGHNFIGTEHILLGLVHTGESTAARSLESLGVTPEAVRRQVSEMVGTGGTAPRTPIPFAPRSKRVLELAMREALERGDNFVGTEHILLGLVREGEGVAAHALANLGAGPAAVRDRTTRLLADVAGRETPGGTAAGGQPGH